MRALIGLGFSNAIVLSVLAITLPVRAATILDTTTNWDGAAVGYWGEPPYTATLGQTFAVGSDNRLDNFTFSIVEASGSEHVDFRAYVQEWSNATSRAVGPVLFQSGLLHTMTQAWESFSVDTGGLTLTPGKQYVAYFSTSLIDTGDGRAWAGYTGETYAPGTFVYIDNGTNFAALTSTAWVTTYPGGDMAFKMSFNVPEPTALWLAAFGGVGLMRRKQGVFLNTSVRRGLLHQPLVDPA